MEIIENRRSPSVRHSSRLSCPWRLIRSGLNLEGLCTNSQCSAGGQMVIINLGFGEYDFARIILERNNQCPICKVKISPIKYALTKCRWWYVNHYSTRTFPLNIVDDKYELNDLKCEYVIIEIMPLLTNNKITSKSQVDSCPICLGNIDEQNSDAYAIILRCKHTFHRNCIDQWLQSNESMANKCPMCRVYIAERSE